MDDPLLTPPKLKDDGTAEGLPIYLVPAAIMILEGLLVLVVGANYYLKFIKGCCGYFPFCPKLFADMVRLARDGILDEPIVTL